MASIPQRRRTLSLVGPLCLATVLATGGCASLTRSHYTPPELAVGPTWNANVDGATRPASGHWWDQFGDSQLSTLVGQVLDSNNDLAGAGIRLRQARLSADLAATQLLPSFDGNLSTGASRSLEDNNTGWNTSSSTTLGASWELDLFGRLDAQRDAARWEAQASEQDLAATRLALVGTTVKAWWQLAYAHERIALARQTLDYTRKALELVQIQYKAGAVSRLDLRDAQQTVASQEVTLTRLEQGRVEARNTIGALLGQQDTVARNAPPCPMHRCPPSTRACLPSFSRGAPIWQRANCACARHWPPKMPRLPASIPGSP